jgi:hypothetical protein
MATETSAPRVAAVTGRPSWVRLAVCTVGAAGAMTLIVAAAFGVGNGSSPLWAALLTVSMIIAWAPLACWAAWWISVPAVLAVGVLLACLTHRYRLPGSTSPPEGRRSRWYRIGRACTAVILACGAWTLVVGAIMLLSNVLENLGLTLI